ncbi:MAG: hypothetical protein ABI556_05245 [Gemmatimonadales bacterium]
MELLVKTVKKMMLISLSIVFLVSSTMAQTNSKATVRLLVGNLPSATTEPDLKLFFNESGVETLTVQVVKSSSNGQPLLVGFVKVELSNAEKAVNLANVKKFMGNTLSIGMSPSDKQKVKNYKKTVAQSTPVTAPTPVVTTTQPSPNTQPTAIASPTPNLTPSPVTPTNTKTQSTPVIAPTPVVTTIQPSPNIQPTAIASPTPNLTPSPVTPANTNVQVATLAPIKSDAEKRADELIGEYIQARGGMNKLKAINTLRFTGKMILGPGFEAALTMEMARPDKSRMEFTLQGMTGIQTYDGKNGWMVSPFFGKTLPEPVTGSELESLRAQADFDGPLIDYESKGYRVEFAGKEDVEGSPAYKLKLTKNNSEISFLYLDTEMHQLFRESHKTTLNGQVIESVTDFGDYKAVGGVLFAHSITTKAAGLPAAAQVMRIEKIEINPNLPDTRFGKP